MTWKVIADAPRDGTAIILFYPEYRVKGLGETEKNFPYNRLDSGVCIGGYQCIGYWFSYEAAQSAPEDEDWLPEDMRGKGGYWETLNGVNLSHLAEDRGPSHWHALPTPPTL